MTGESAALKLRALEAATEALGSSDVLEDVTRRMVEAVCRGLGWSAGATWVADARTERLELCSFWSRRDLPAFEAASRASALGPTSFPGRVSAARTPIWIEDVTRDADFTRRASALRDRLGAAIGVPIVFGGHVLGVMEFFADEAQEPDASVMRMFAVLGTEIGLLIERGRAQDAQRHERRRVSGLLAAERRVLEIVARGAPLGVALDELTRTIETLAPGMLASVLVLDGDGVRLRHGAASSLPPAYCAAIDGTPIGPDAGSCGTAAYERRVVVAEDIATDPRWARWADLALRHELRACWSAPIFGAGGRVLGTFALYYRRPRVPERDHLELIEAAAHVAGIAIERHALDAERAAMIEDLSRAVRFNEMFVGVLGHDLRNPLSAILTAAAVIKRHAASDAAIRNADRIIVSGTRMNRMIEQLLDFTRIRLGHGVPVEHRAVDLADVCRHVTDEIGAGDRVELTAVGNTTGSWDRDRLLQLVSNLVGNAVQHGATDAPVAVRVDGTAADTVVLSVANAGEVPAPVLSTLFDPFRRALPTDAPRRRGLGLGLFISRHVAQAHGGTIEVTAGNGTTTFVVRLPRGDAATGAARAVTFDAQPRAQDRRTVVLVDDDAELCGAVAEMLADDGYDVVTSGTAERALADIRKAPRPCVVVLDMSLPDGDGAAIHRAMRAEPSLAGIPVVLFTAAPHKAPSGVLMIRKPVDPKLLLETIQKLFPSAA